MGRLRYQVACSLDGFIAGPEDEFDWITPEPSFDFEALRAQFDTLLMGRRTYEIVHAMGESFYGKQVIVASRSLRQEDHPDIEVVSEGLEARVQELRVQPGRDIWLYGGGDLFSQLLEWNLVDTVEPAIIPILLGGGIPLLPAHGVRRRLAYIRQHTYTSGMVLLEYDSSMPRSSVKSITPRHRACAGSEIRAVGSPIRNDPAADL
jgi:dihydrofolate reductase